MLRGVLRGELPKVSVNYYSGLLTVSNITVGNNFVLPKIRKQTKVTCPQLAKVISNLLTLMLTQPHHKISVFTYPFFVKCFCIFLNLIRLLSKHFYQQAFLPKDSVSLLFTLFSCFVWCCMVDTEGKIFEIQVSRLLENAFFLGFFNFRVSWGVLKKS